MMRSIGNAFRMLLFLTLLTGITYPLLVTGIARLLFPFQSNGSILIRQGKPVGSLLIGQPADSSGIYFGPRPSAGSYNPLPSGGSNYSLTNRRLREQFVQRQQQFREYNLQDRITEVPSEMLFASASGLDPHISPEAALLQVDRVSRARKFPEAQKAQLQDLVYRLTEPPQFLFLGQERINVLLLNLETDKIR